VSYRQALLIYISHVLGHVRGREKCYCGVCEMMRADSAARVNEEVSA